MCGLICTFGVIATFVTFLSGSGAVTTEILEPIRSSGDEVALIFIPGIHIKGEQYRNTAQAIQENSQLRIWAALTEDYVMNVVNSRQVEYAVEDAIRELKRAGMTSGDYIGIGHGGGGHLLQAYAKDNSDLKAIVLMGSHLPDEFPLRDFPIPVLTLAAELDGLTRITRIAEEYEKLMDDKLWSFLRGLYTTPVIYIEDANHAQFASGDMPPFIEKGDLFPNVTEEVVHSVIGKHVNNFLTANFGSVDSQIDTALEQLSATFMKSMKKFQPFLDVRDLDRDGTESLWTVLAQEYFAGEYSDRVGIYNEVLENPSFFMKEPSIRIMEDYVVVGTAALIGVDKKSHLHSPYMSPFEIDMKLVSRGAIERALNKTDSSSLKSEPNECKHLNQLALAVALRLSSEKAQERYLTKGRDIIFEDDVMRGMNFLWAPTPLKMWEDADSLHVRSVAMVTPTRSVTNLGVHLCKVMSPYRAMEWVNIDSLRLR